MRGQVQRETLWRVHVRGLQELLQEERTTEPKLHMQVSGALWVIRLFCLLIDWYVDERSVKLKRYPSWSSYVAIQSYIYSVGE